MSETPSSQLLSHLREAQSTCVRGPHSKPHIPLGQSLEFNRIYDDAPACFIADRDTQRIFENPQVRVFRSWREPGGVERMHQHVGAGRVAVLLTPIHAQVTLDNCSTVMQDNAAGDVSWSLPVKHSAKNLGSQKFEMIVVEVK